MFIFTSRKKMMLRQWWRQAEEENKGKYFLSFAHYKEAVLPKKKCACLIIFALSFARSSFSFSLPYTLFLFFSNRFLQAAFFQLENSTENLILCWVLYLSIFLFLQMKRIFQHFFPSSFLSLFFHLFVVIDHEFNVVSVKLLAN